MPSLCKFGRFVIDIVEDHIDAEEFWIPNEWRLYHDIEDAFTGAGWIEGGEALDLRNRVDELEGEVRDLEDENVEFEDEISRLEGELREEGG